MSRIEPVSRERAADLSPLYEGLEKKFGRVPNIFGVMAHRPDALKSFLPFYTAVVAQGTVAARHKELAYLKTSLLNGCQY
jgi:alkylhydroperoxidase family enzyme